MKNKKIIATATKIENLYHLNDFEKQEAAPQAAIKCPSNDTEKENLAMTFWSSWSKEFTKIGKILSGNWP